MIRDFIAIDFETANQQPSSVCSIGVVMVCNGQVADRVDFLRDHKRFQEDITNAVEILEKML